MIKLSPTQKKLVAALKEGKVLKRDMTFHGGYYLQSRTEGWARRKLNINTVMALYKQGLLSVESTKFPFEILVLNLASLENQKSSNGEKQ